MPKGPCHLRSGSVNFQSETGLKLAIPQLKYGVYDPENRLHGTLQWHKPWGEQEFPCYAALTSRSSIFNADLVLRGSDPNTKAFIKKDGIARVEGRYRLFLGMDSVNWHLFFRFRGFSRQLFDPSITVGFYGSGSAFENLVAV